MIGEIRENVEQRLKMYHDRARAHNEQWMNVSSPSEPLPSRYDAAQLYILIQILDYLKSIDDTLISMHSGKSGRE